MNPDNHFEDNIPTLTEVIPSQGKANPALSPVTDLELNLPHQPHSYQDHELAQLEKKVVENVLNQLLGRVDFVLEHRIRDSLADVMETAVEGLAKNIRQGLRNSLQDVIQRALSQELSKLRSAHPKI